MSIGWNFPSNNYGTINGIGEAGIETFKGNPYRSLAREICQNSLDAKATDDEPVIVEFSSFQKNISDLPDFDHLKDALDACLDFWTKQNNKKTVDFFRKAVAAAGQNNISVLRISDFNTTGLTGSDQDYNTPWQNLVKAAGVSDKDGSSGGSFGIGKSAPFACSDLRTVFYTTYDINGLKAGQGIARLVSFVGKDGFSDQDKDQITTGIGYYGDKNQNRAIPECRSLDPDFKRTEIGTDVYILGFSGKKGWQKEVIAAVLDDFLISVYLGLLEVNVEGVVISQQTLAEILERYKEDVPMANNYYQTLVSKEAHVITENFENLGEIEVHLLIQNGLHRRVFMSRKNGMKVFDQKNFPSAIQFAGICILKDESINAYFREMENPQHDAWEPERHNRPSEAKKKKQALFRFIKENVLDIGRRTTVAETDAEGVGDYLPDAFTPAAGSEHREDVVDTTKRMDFEISGLKSVQKGFEKRHPLDDKGMEDIEGLPENEAFGESGSKDHGEKEKNDVHDGSGFGSEPGDGSGTNGSGNNPYQIGTETSIEEHVKREFEIQMMSVRLMSINAGQKWYCLVFKPGESAERGSLTVKLSGEQGNQDVTILEAENILTKETLAFDRNKIYLNDIAAKKKMCIGFKVDFNERSSMEVALHGYQV